jgi:hypothetical protein
MIYINIVYRAEFVPDDYLETACFNALETLRDAGYTPAEAYSVYQAEWAWLGTKEAIVLGRWQDQRHLKDPRSRAWVLAQDAANCVLEELWHDDGHPLCLISA